MEKDDVEKLNEIRDKIEQLIEVKTARIAAVNGWYNSKSDDEFLVEKLELAKGILEL